MTYSIPIIRLYKFLISTITIRAGPIISYSEFIFNFNQKHTL